MRTTCHGYYDADPSEELWNWIVNVKGLKTFNYNDEQVTFSDSYTAEDDEKQKKAVKYLCENPENPFFDINTVISSNGSYAFNIETYLNRYKTINSEGQTQGLFKVVCGKSSCFAINESLVITITPPAA